MNVLKAEDIKVGQKIMVTENLRTRDRSYLNMVMTVKAVDLPYIIVERKAWFEPGMTNMSMLTTEYCFAEPSPEFIEALETAKVGA